MLEYNGHFLAREGGEVPSTSLAVSEICEKDLVAEMIRSGEYIVVRKERSKSKVWEKFFSVYDTQKRCVGYVQCSNCASLLPMKLGSGTVHLSRHVCRNNAEPEVLTVSAKVKNTLSSVCLEKCVEMCVKDLVLASTVSGKGFRILCQELVKIGAVHGNINISCLLPSADTLLKHLSVVTNRLRENVIPVVLKAIDDGICALDVWTEKVEDMIRAIVTSHYISDDWKICRHVLVSFQYPEEPDLEIRSAVRRFLMSKLSSIDLPAESINKLTFVTSDSQEYINSHIPCAASRICTVIKNTFDDRYLQLRCREIWECVCTAKLIVHKLGNNGLLDHLKAMNKTSLLPFWNYSLLVLEIVFNNYELINHIFTRKKEGASLLGWNRQLMSDIVPFLEKFKEVIIELQNHTYPTLHLVLVYLSQLTELCTPCPSDHSETVVIKREVKCYLQDVVINKEHYIATFLCPHTRLLKQLDSETKREVHEDVRDMCSKVRVCPENTSEPQPAKKSRFGSWCQSEEDDGTSLDEVALYLATGKQESEDPRELLTWWQEKAKTFPRLSCVARKMLCIPATCSPYGQYSNLSALFAAKDISLAYDQVSDLLFIHNKIMAGNSQGQPESTLEERVSEKKK